MHVAKPQGGPIAGRIGCKHVGIPSLWGQIGASSLYVAGSVARCVILACVYLACGRWSGQGQPAARLLACIDKIRLRPGQVVVQNLLVEYVHEDAAFYAKWPLHGGRIMAPTTVKSTYCWICGKEVSLGDCKTDENGRAVHEDCYIAQMKLESESQRATGLPVNSI